MNFTLLSTRTVRFGVLAFWRFEAAGGPAFCAFWRFEADGRGTGRVLCVLCVLDLRLTSNNKQILTSNKLPLDNFFLTSDKQAFLTSGKQAF